MVLAEIIPILAIATKGGKVSFVINQFASLNVFMEHAWLIKMVKKMVKTIFAFAKPDGKMILAASVYLIGIVQIKAMMPVWSPMNVFVMGIPRDLYVH